MKLAFVARNAPDALDQLYLELLRDRCEQLVAGGHDVTVFWVQISGAPGIPVFSGVTSKIIDAPMLDTSAHYLHAFQALSDGVAQSVLESLGDASLDCIEFPLMGGLAFSLVRSKRLMGVASSCKLAINALVPPSGEGELGELESLLCYEMESYCLRYADLVSAPFEAVGEEIKRRIGRNDIRYYDASGIIAACHSGSDAKDRSLDVLRYLVNSHQPQYAPMELTEIYASRVRKRFVRAIQPARVAAVFPIVDADTVAALQDSIVECPGVSLQWVAYLTSDTIDARKVVSELEREGIPCVKIVDGAVWLHEVLRHCDADFAVFLRPGMKLSLSYLSSAVAALQRNSELAVMGAYAEGSALPYPFAAVPGLMTVHPTFSLWGNVFRMEPLRRLQDADIALNPLCCDIDLLLALMERYQLMEILPFTGLDYSGIDIQVFEHVRSPGSILSQLERFPRTWKGQAARLVTLLVSGLLRLDLDGTKQRTPAWEVTSLNAARDALTLAALPESRDSAMESTRVGSWKTSIGLLDTQECEQLLDSGEQLSSVQASDESEPVDPISDEEESHDNGIRFDEELEETTLIAAESSESGVAQIQPLRLAKSDHDEVADPKDAANLEDIFQVFWSSGESFDEAHSQVQPYLAETTSELEIRVDSSAMIARVRLDPSNRSGKVSLRRIELWDNHTHKPIFATSEDNAFDNLMPHGDLEVEGIERDLLLLCATGNDPQILLDLEGASSDSITVFIEFEFVREP